MKNGYLLGADIGTTNVKAAVFDTDGREIAACSSEIPLRHVRQGWVEQHPRDWWQGFVECLRGLKPYVSLKDIAAICVSSQAPALVPVDERGEVLHPALIWMDRRALPQCEEIRRAMDEKDLHDITGCRIDPYYVLPKLLWLREERPEAFSRTWKFLQVNGYVNYKLTGEASLDVTHASLTQLYDVKRGVFSEEVLAKFGIPREKLPRIYEATEPIGVVTREAAEECGLSPGTLVVAGCIDGASGALESGVLKSGDAAESTGTSTVLMLGSDRLCTHPKLVYARHALPGKHILCGTMSTTGAAYKWFRDILFLPQQGQDIEHAFARMEAEILKDAPQPGNVLFLPFLSGERSPLWDASLSGAFLGIKLSTSRAELMRSIMECTSLALRHNIEIAREIGIDIPMLRSGGGGSRSELWLKIKASVLGTPIRVPELTLDSSFGCAVIAGLGAGIFSDLSVVERRMETGERVIEPVEAWRSHYDEFYEIYKESIGGVRDTLHALSAMKGN